ncbi:peptidoglycan L-alanyl-D-glutamate endopeptidase CwlK [Paenibacillus algorifonticola]|uniref:Peptidoglycan L-alanyl-D-glutamate endopeptidase CwlK n=1 Tax=Paenibacillus algorifonticola TaxID=684063 RepID=A0A1I2H263_9BACL|nr:peptidoglycan L-alanyl-D-glutamate endopeptidase CwlK [Paenibacillus algorifonticola]
MLTLTQVKSKSAARLAGLLPVVAAAADRLIERAYNRGVPIVIVQGLRTIAEQDALYAQGRTVKFDAKGNKLSIVTQVKGGYSFHNYGVAIDFALLAADGKQVYWDTKRDGDFDGVADWTEVVQEAKALGFAWGGEWTSFKDYPHFEMTFGLTTAQYRAGQRPTAVQIAAAQAKIEQGDEEGMTAAEQKAFEALGEKASKQEELIEGLEKRLADLESKHKMSVPSWAQSSVDAAVKAGLIDTPDGGSYDFYRFVVLLKRKGLI